jgi:hypothetical protein
VIIFYIALHRFFKYCILYLLHIEYMYANFNDQFILYVYLSDCEVRAMQFIMYCISYSLVIYVGYFSLIKGVRSLRINCPSSICCYCPKEYWPFMGFKGENIENVYCSCLVIVQVQFILQEAFRSSMRVSQVSLVNNLFLLSGFFPEYHCIPCQGQADICHSLCHYYM